MRTHLQTLEDLCALTCRTLEDLCALTCKTLKGLCALTCRTLKGYAQSLAERLKKLRTDRPYSSQGLGSGFEFDALRVRALSCKGKLPIDQP